MADIKAKKEKKSSSQTISKLDSKTTPNRKGGLFSDLLMPRGLGKMDENTGLNPSLLKCDGTLRAALRSIPGGRKGTGGSLGTREHKFLGRTCAKQQEGLRQSLKGGRQQKGLERCLRSLLGLGLLHSEVVCFVLEAQTRAFVCPLKSLSCASNASILSPAEWNS